MEPHFSAPSLAFWHQSARPIRALDLLRARISGLSSKRQTSNLFSFLARNAHTHAIPTIPHTHWHPRPQKHTHGHTHPHTHAHAPTVSTMHGSGLREKFGPTGSISCGRSERSWSGGQDLILRQLDRPPHASLVTTTSGGRTIFTGQVTTNDPAGLNFSRLPYQRRDGQILCTSVIQRFWSRSRKILRIYLKFWSGKF